MSVEKLTITVVADPMMGMLWETWPTMRKLETHFGDQIEFKFMMGQLVKDVYDLVDNNVVQMYNKKVALNQYWTRLMQIYLQEEKIAGMPIYMGGNERLFDENHTSSVPLNKGFRAIAGHDTKLEDRVIYEMQYDTVVENRQTTDLKYLIGLAEKFGITPAQFKERFNSTGIDNELEQEQQVMQQTQIDQLPAYLLTYNDKTYVVKGLPKYSEWLKLVDQVSQGKLKQQDVEFSLDAVNAVLDRHPHISSLELKEAFDLDDEQEVIDLLKDQELNRAKVKETIFYRKN